ncbi:hypothetical protein V1525DRAFT_434192 [Lipomyces kononenkoae]|uniref:Uncharacterized protein n=1 Tax=Lipomyces kononenkoae TaxID=34357 RepID=A0ACC3SWG6_LIPKO
MGTSSASSTSSQIHALLDMYQSLTSRYHPSDVTFKLEVYNDPDLLLGDKAKLSSPSSSGCLAPVAVQSMTINPVNSSRQPVAVLYADVHQTRAQSPASTESSRPPLLSYAEMRALLAGYSDDEEYTRYKSESSEMDPQHTADSEIFLTTRSKLLYGEIQRDAKLSLITESDIPESPEKAPQLKLPEFEEFTVEKVLDSVVVDHDSELRMASDAETGQSSMLSGRGLSIGHFDSSKVTPRSRSRQKALKLRRYGGTNFSPVISRTARDSPWYTAGIGRSKEMDYGRFHPDVSWSVEYRFKQVLRELSEHFKLQQCENARNHGRLYSFDNAPLSLQLFSGDTSSPAENVRDYVPFNSPQTPKVFGNGMQRSTGKLHLSSLTHYQIPNNSPEVEQSSIRAIPPSDKRAISSRQRDVRPGNQSEPATADDRLTETVSSIHAEIGSMSGPLKTYSWRRLTWSNISGKSTSKYSFRKILAHPSKVQISPATPRSQVGSCVTAEHDRASESDVGRAGQDKKNSASLTSPVRILLEKLSVKKKLKAATKRVHVLRSLSSRRIMPRRAI